MVIGLRKAGNSSANTRSNAYAKPLSLWNAGSPGSIGSPHNVKRRLGFIHDFCRCASSYCSKGSSSPPFCECVPCSECDGDC
jgi:hypothetical protein